MPIEEQIRLAAALDVGPLTARALLLRGLGDEVAAKGFLDAGLAALPDPDLLPAMTTACDRLEQALRDGERIAVHGDYDVDGISGCTLLVEVLRDLGAEVEYHIPLRLKDGYGLSADAIRQAKAQGCSLLLSVDCGVSAHAEAALAAELGLDLIITDHHQPPDDLPPCLALVNPHLPGNHFPWPDLSGVGVAFFLLAGLRRWLRERDFFVHRPEPDLRCNLDLVALGTIADLVPLGGVNRILTRVGLQLLDQGRRPGIAELKKVAAIKQVTCGSVGFRLAPRLNAAGRLEDAALGVKLLLGDGSEDLSELAETLDQINSERQKIEQQTLEEAITLLEKTGSDDRFTIVLADERWHSGVIGIVASRLVERYHRPTVMIALDEGIGKGSCRSIADFNLYQALHECAGSLSAYGGHAMAAGLSLAAENIPAFSTAFEQVARERLSAEELIPVLTHDGECRLSELSFAQIAELERLQPFGIGNPQPAFIARQCRVHDVRILGDRHLKFTAEQDGCRSDCIAFGMAERSGEVCGQVDLLFRPGINEWRGRRTPQLQVVDFREVQDD